MSDCYAWNEQSEQVNAVDGAQHELLCRCMHLFPEKLVNDCWLTPASGLNSIQAPIATQQKQ